MTVTMGSEGFWCPHCGEWIENWELDENDLREMERNGDCYFVCPECHDSFYVEKGEDNGD